MLKSNLITTTFLTSILLFSTVQQSYASENVVNHSSDSNTHSEICIYSPEDMKYDCVNSSDDNFYIEDECLSWLCLPEEGDLNLNIEEVRILARAELIHANNPNLKVDNIHNYDDEHYMVEFVTLDDSLVKKVNVNKFTGEAYSKNE